MLKGSRDCVFAQSRNVGTKKELLGHRSVETTMVYTHVVAEMNKSRVASPLNM